MSSWIIEKQDNEFRIFQDKTLVTIVYDSEAHAKLIAAAPQMLEALKLIVWKLKDEPEKHQTYLNWFELSDLVEAIGEVK